jgi:hypothetical protein
MAFGSSRKDIGELGKSPIKRSSLDIKLGHVETVPFGDQVNFVVDVEIKGIKDHFKTGLSVDKSEKADFDPIEAAKEQVGLVMKKAGFDLLGERRGYNHYERPYHD